MSEMIYCGRALGSLTSEELIVAVRDIMTTRAVFSQAPADDNAAAVCAIKAELMRVGFDVSGPLTNTVLAVKDICDARETTQFFERD